MPTGSPIENGLPLRSTTLVPSILFVFFVFLMPASATPKNITIDDQGGDQVTREVPLYQPSYAWVNEKCVEECAIRLDVGQLFNHTATTTAFFPDKHDSISSTIDLNFTGTAIYIFFTLLSNEGPGITVKTECDFTMDGEHVGFFNHSGDPTRLPGTGREYEALVFSKTGLFQEQHHMRISVENYPIFLSFDKAVYTSDNDPLIGLALSSSPFQKASISSPVDMNREFDVTNTPSSVPGNDSSSSVPPGVIAGGIVGGVVVLVGFIALVYYYRRDRKRYRQPRNLGPTTPRPFVIPPSRSETALQGQPSMLHSSTPTSPTLSQSLSSGSGHQGSVEHRIRAANQRMRSLRAEMASVSGHTGTSSNSSNSRTPSSTVMEELTEEVKKLRQELQALKQVQRHQAHEPPVLEEPPPIYTPDFNP